MVMAPHGLCLQWNPWLIGLNVTGDWMIWLAYTALPILLLVLHGAAVGKIRHTHELWMFAAFIGLCGATHAVSIVEVWFPIYWFAGCLKIVTGLVSLYVAFHVTTCLGHVMDSFRELDLAVRGDAPLRPRR